jgi:hypothetical protein
MSLRDHTVEVHLSASSQQIAQLLREAKTRDEGVSKPDLEKGADTRFVEDKITALNKAGYAIGKDIEDGEPVYVLVHDPDVERRVDTAPSLPGIAVGKVNASLSTEPERLFGSSSAHFDWDLAA